jgi:hypothetical protein
MSSPEQKSVAQMWDLYAQLAIGASMAGPQRIRDARRAFYAGVHSALLALLFAVGDDSVPEEVGTAYLQRLDDECNQFAADIAARRA